MRQRDLNQSQHRAAKGASLDHPPNSCFGFRSKRGKTRAGLGNDLADEIASEGTSAPKPLFQSFEACLFAQSLVV